MTLILLGLALFILTGCSYIVIDVTLDLKQEREVS